MRYELIREIFNLCSNNQMRDVFVSEVETSDPEVVARTYCRGKDVTMDRTDNEDGSIIFDVVADGLHQLTIRPEQETPAGSTRQHRIVPLRPSPDIFRRMHLLNCAVLPKINEELA